MRKKQQKMTKQRSDKFKMSLLALDQQQVKALQLMKRMEKQPSFFKTSSKGKIAGTERLAEWKRSDNEKQV